MRTVFFLMFVNLKETWLLEMETFQFLLDNVSANLVDIELLMGSWNSFISIITYDFLFNNFLVESAKTLQDVEEVSEHKGVSLSKTPIELKGAHWSVKVVPWIGGRIISMTHLPSGNNFVIVVIFSNSDNITNFTFSFRFQPFSFWSFVLFPLCF